MLSRSLVTSTVASVELWQFSETSLTGYTVVFFITATLLWVVYRSFLYPFYLSPLRHVPTVPGCPLWGHTYERFTCEIGRPEREWHKNLGPMVRFFLPFGIERLSVADDQAIREIQVRDSYNFVRPQRVIRWIGPILGERGILLANGDLHARQRKALAPAFSTASIRRLKPTFWKHGLLLADKFTGLICRPSDNDTSEDISSQCVEVLDRLQRATLDLIGEASFGWEVDSLNDAKSPLRNVYASIFALDLMSCIVQTLRLYFNLVKFIPCRMNRAMESGSRVVNDTARAIIETKTADMDATAASHDIISQVITQTHALPKVHPDRLQLREIHDDIMTIFGAGHDTTATALAWTLDQLSKHPFVQTKLRTEVLACIPILREPSCHPSSLARINVDKLPYLNKVCRESLRYIPPIPTVSRQNIRATHLGGYFIPAGTSVHVTANAINHLPGYWGVDADKFDPDRWDDLPEEWRPNAYQSFLAGPRGCIGRRFAETEMKIFLCCLLARFEFGRDERAADQEGRKMWRLVLRPKDGISLKLRLVV